MGQPAASPAIAALRERIARLEGGPTRNRASLPFG
ncbi:MAG: damage-inducible protein, partial [Mesorhizobium sp.]